MTVDTEWAGGEATRRPEPSREIAEVEPVELALVNPETGESLAPTVDNAALVIEAARRTKTRLDTLIAAATEVSAEESRRLGKKTLRLDDGRKLVLHGGPTTDYDPELLRAALTEADCPEERIDEVIRAHVEYKVDKAVLKQLTGANEDYAAAAELAAVEKVERWSASIKEVPR